MLERGAFPQFTAKENITTALKLQRIKIVVVYSTCFLVSDHGSDPTST